MIIFDSHLDLAWNALNWNRDLTLPIADIRASERADPDPRRGANTVCFPEMRRGNVAICLGTVLARSTTVGQPLLDYRTQEIASAMGHGQRTYYEIMQRQGHLRLLRNAAELDTHVKQWQSGVDAPIGCILSMEGADPILDNEDAARWWELGLRVVGLSHYGLGIYAHGTSSSGGLTARGFELLNAFEALGMIVDVTHLTDEGFWQVIDRYSGPLLARHNNRRGLVPGNRQFSDEQIRALIEHGGVIGVACDSWMLRPNYIKTDNAQVTLGNVADQIDHICHLAGNAEHVAIGSDLDGGFGKEQSPSDLDTIADLQKLIPRLKDRHYQPSDIENVMHGNWLRFFQAAWSRDVDAVGGAAH